MKMTRLEWLARRLVLILGLGAGAAACDANEPLPAPPTTASATTPTETPTPAPTSRAALEAQVEQDLARLRALEVVEVGGLVIDLPGSPGACYGHCSERDLRKVPDAALSRQAPRVHALADIGDSVLENSYPTTLDVSRAGAAIAALDALAIVDLGGLLTVGPANNPSCYNLPCSEDVAKAKLINESRSWFLTQWAQMAVGAKP
jgi:hypothetical protein